MFDRVIVGVDGRDSDRDAIALARVLAPDARLTLLTAYPYPYASAPELDFPSDAELDLRRHADATLESARDSARAAAHLVALPDMSPARALQRIAEREHADLIVVGSAHRGPVGRVFLGDVSRSTLHGAPCAVAVAPASFAATAANPSVVGVGYDARAEAAEALALAQDVAREAGARLRLQSVVQPLSPVAGGYVYTDSWQELTDRQVEAAQRAIDDAVSHLEIPASGEVVKGSPGELLAKLSAEVDLLVTGSRGWGPVRRVLLGSTSDYVAHHASCPLLVVPRSRVDARPASETVKAGVAGR